MNKRIPLSFTINGEEVDLYIPPNKTLLEVLREELELTGTKEGCGEGVCGSCTVLCDGVPVRSCLTLAVEVDGREVTTVEGLGKRGKLDPLQRSFIDHGAVQCGFCTPGMLMSAKGLLNRNPVPDQEEIRRGLSGNICRCTGYAKIVEAVTAVTTDANPNNTEG
ncbi:MAG: (2Fe-2S)-binding protein [Deltaproteobacteria bacterium]|nr:(2Fe-2S)-binding protein [Deltaproteobacteria bacterium]MBW2048265.1 (2Fe-2S)-binding protein [Deltaproteobacteria bacterium]MBW2110005.1 (2Fe-2S)-binding protein [Deltaproteobacteria bacterium]MBW2351794.1 (2Fe-2S)-binding protein [Deltaproteobacteria bacterium]